MGGVSKSILDKNVHPSLREKCILQIQSFFDKETRIGEKLLAELEPELNKSILKNLEERGITGLEALQTLSIIDKNSKKGFKNS